MPVYRIAAPLVFPSPDEAEPDGLLAVGGDLAPKRLLVAYSTGIFPWYHEGIPILWYSPDPRTVLLPSRMHVGRSVRRALRRAALDVRLDTAFGQVIRACADVRRPGQPGTWITHDMETAYCRLHQLGYAHSAEAWVGERLVGGVYGVALGGVFFGESMFAEVDDASKVAFVWLVRQLEAWGFELVDCQMRTAHLARFGAVSWPRARYLYTLRRLLAKGGRRGRWQFDAGFRPPELARASTLTGA